MSDCKLYAVSMFTRMLAIILAILIPQVQCRHNDLPCNPDSHPEDCPPWFTCRRLNNNSVYCDCIDDTLQGAIKCQQESFSTILDIEYHISYDNATDCTTVGRCSQYETPWNITNYPYAQLPPTLSGLNSSCKSLRRSGPLCANCIKGYGPGVFSYDLQCYKCTGHYHGWGIYFFLELSLSTLFFCIIVSCRISATTASMNIFVLLSQVVAAIFAYKAPIFEQSFGKPSAVLVKVFQTCYGIWNLDFFRSIIPPFCVSDGITNIHALALQYISALYPLCLIGITYVFIELYDHNYRPIVWLWAPFQTCFTRCRRTYNPKETIIGTFATFLLLSYTKLIFVSSNLLDSTTVYTHYTTNTSIQSTLTPLWDTSIKFFGKEHFPFAMLAVIVLSTFVAIPLLFLCLYPTKTFQKCVGNRNCHAMHAFADAFQGCFKDGTKGMCDCRYFAGVYLLLRISLFLTHSMIPSRLNSWVAPAAIFMLVSLSFMAFRPYKRHIFNIIDCSFLAVVSTGTFLVALIPYAEDKIAFGVTVFILLSSPLLYISSYVIYSALSYTNILQKLQICSQFSSLHNQNERNRENSNTDLFPDRLLNPEDYTPLLP